MNGRWTLHASSWRQPSRLLLAPLRSANYRTLLRGGRVFPETTEMLRRYVFNDGDYPYDIPIRTPQGVISPTLYSLHDIRTANEVFCREDYRDPGNTRVVVDVGANIGLSALYFLTRDERCRVYCYEPSPVNIPRLRHNLSAYSDRTEIHERAVAERAGEIDFVAEPTGRYGAILREGAPSDPANVVRVTTDDVNDMLSAVLEREERVDVLKIDTEGSELPIIEAVRPDLQRRISTVYLELEPTGQIHPDVFEQRQRGSICRLTARTSSVA